MAGIAHARRLIACLMLALVVAACKSVPAPVVTAPSAPPMSLDTRVAWTLRLEQQRALRDAAAEPAPSESRGAPGTIAPARVPDLTILVHDTDPAVRRRAALAIGRVGRAEGAPALVAALGDPEEKVREMAAFALGLIAAAPAVAPLQNALKDVSPIVRGRAAESLGLIGLASAAASVADAGIGCREVLVGIAPDDETFPKTPEIELCRLTMFSLVRLKDYDQLARVVLDDQGRPVSTWWPVAFALQRIGDKRAAEPLLTLASTEGVYTAAFAFRGLGAAGETRAAPLARAVVARATADIRLRVAAARALGLVGGPGAVDGLLELVRNPDTPPNLALEAVIALGDIGDQRAFDPLLDAMTHPWPSMRAAVLAAAAKINGDGFLLVAGGLPLDADWSVRAELAGILATLPADKVRAGVIDLTVDKDMRVRGPALRALAKVGAPDLARRLVDALNADDFVVRAVAAELLGEARPADGAAALAAAYTRAESDAAYGARAAAVAALGQYGTDEAKAVIRRALEDKDWPVRLRAAEVLRSLGDASAAPGSPAPLRRPAAYFESEAFLRPTVSPHAFIETKKGTIELELDLVQAPVTSQSFVDLAKLGFFNGVRVHRLVPNFVMQAGDPRGDGEGGPGFTVMDELSPTPYVRGTVGMALDWRDTAGSQFFITMSPHPHLDAKYTVFGRVVQGSDVLDRLSQWDTIDRVRIWDGVSFQ
jgi:HEAT repeat protein